MQRLGGLAEKRIYNVSAPLEHRMCKIYGDLEVQLKCVANLRMKSKL